MTTKYEPLFWVLMGNDYPAAILYGTEAEAEAYATHRNKEDIADKEKIGCRPRMFWRVYLFEPIALGKSDERAALEALVASVQKSSLRSSLPEQLRVALHVANGILGKGPTP